MVEYDGMILLHPPSQENRRRLEESDQSLCRWQYERFANHVHARMSAADREHVRQEREIAAGFEDDLRRQYPHCSFVITHLPCYAVSFYQAIENAPVEDDPLGPAKEKVWCQTCERSGPYRLLPVPDAEFPQAEWGQCEVCGSDVIVRSGEIRTLIKGL